MFIDEIPCEAGLPRPEYPRPQMSRSEWLNLNGEWEFAFDDSDAGLRENWCDGRPFERRITVPFAYQTELSGINDKGVHEIVWYARNFTVPKEWADREILLHFGAVDYRSSVWINGKEVGHNQGGHVPFSFMVSPYLQEGENRLTVRVEDRQDPHQPRGKQSSSGMPHDIDYYCTSGIWQTVWLEPVPKMRVEDLRITPLVQQSAFEVVVYLHAPSTGWLIRAKLIDEGQTVQEVEQRIDYAVSYLRLPVPEPKLWSPNAPHLYELEITLHNGAGPIDQVHAYAGMRSITLESGKILLNGDPCFLAMVLDQGYWPKGGMTAPTDQDLRADIEWTKLYGFNGARKHQKVEDPRWLYWCDRLGLLVWAEMANARAWSPKAEEWLMGEWERAVRRSYNHPSVVAWVPMNESWGMPELRQNHPGQFAYMEKMVAITRRLDPLRPVVDNDGWEHSDITDICAIHDYTPSAEGLRERYKEVLKGGPLPAVVWTDSNALFARGAEYHGQPVVLTEVGGFLMIPKDVPEQDRDELYKYYGSCSSEEEFFEKFRDLAEGLSNLTFISGFCYTQLIDVEQEINGLLTYDRKPKLDPAVIRKMMVDLFPSLLR